MITQVKEVILRCEENCPPLFRIMLDHDLQLSVSANIIILLIPALIIGIFFLIKISLGCFSSLEIDQAQLGVGDHKITIKPNRTDMQIAYKIWVELSTRKIGLPIDSEYDVISEIYDSWYSFFGVTRELIKDVPVSKFRRKETEQIITLSIDVLNEGLRPHLTKWQARYRSWYKENDGDKKYNGMTPQTIQQQFPCYDDLINDMLVVNKQLINYRKSMYMLIKNR